MSQLNCWVGTLIRVQIIKKRAWNPIDLGPSQPAENWVQVQYVRERDPRGASQIY
jgi:hypothetical protein